MRRAGFLLSCIVLCAIAIPVVAYADAASTIRAQIEANNQQISALKAEIAGYQKQLDGLVSKKNTLQSTIDSLTISQKQLSSQIKVTQNKIASANLQIRELSNSIGDKESLIKADQDAVAKSLRQISENENIPLVAALLSSNSFGRAWQSVDENMQFNRALARDVADLRIVRAELTTNRDAVAAAKKELQTLENELLLQKRSVDASKSQQTQLLAQTKNQEANYQKMIAQKEEAERTFERELIELQGQLNFIVHPDLLPKVGTGILSWPVSNTFMRECATRKNVFGNSFCLTQFFGNTPFATANPQVYNNHGHNAIDIGTPIGTPILAALSGTIAGTGNTDLARNAKGNRCWSFGKWVLINHGNGLSTLYSHLSTIDVAKGQSVRTGDVIGLSGSTGYATGPHLHFGVYATEGTKIMTLGEFKNLSGTPCANASMPVASLDAYLNPLSYL